uniref:TBC1 domain family member 31 n=1 Tax=Denticeps clupeoides TaxID=299321 RepID=A0AAY4CJ41_9TELE
MGTQGSENSRATVKVQAGTVQRPAKTPRRVHPAKKLQPPAVITGDGPETGQRDGLSKKRLQKVLKAFGEYPSKYRMFVWRSLLCLPENHCAFSSLMQKGVHPAFVTLHERYPIKSPKLQRGLQRVLSALAHWSAIFGETDYLPLVAFPFVKLFQNNPLICFEVVATVIVNWCQHWFEYFPNPPLNVLSMVENVLAHHDKSLLQHFVNCGITSQMYAWPLLETLFSEVLTQDEWLRLFDNIFSNHPSFLLMAVVAYIACCRAPLLQLTLREDFEELRSEAVRQQAEDEAWYVQQELLQQAEEQRRRILQQEEEKLTEQRARLAAMKRELKVKELQMVDAARRRFLKHQQDQRKIQLRRLDDEIQRKMALRDQETAAAVQDVEVRQMELDAQRHVFEQQLTKEQERVNQGVTAEIDTWRRRAELDETTFQNLLQSDTDLSQETKRVLEASLTEAEQLDADLQWKTEVLKRLEKADAEQQKHHQHLAELNRETRAKEEELVHIMMKMEDKKVRGYNNLS